MSAAELLAQARALGVTLSAGVGGKLRYEAPAGLLTPELRQGLAEHKAAILVLLQAEAEARREAREPGGSAEQAGATECPADGILPWEALEPEDRQRLIERAAVIDLRSVLSRDDAEALREAFEERAAIMEHDGGLARSDAEQAAWAIVSRLRRLH